MSKHPVIRENINFTLEQGGGFSGIVTDNNDVPLNQGRICVDSLPDGNFYNCWNVNTNGTYTVDGLPTGTYRARVEAVPGYVVELYDNLSLYGANWSNATPISVTAGVIAPTNINFALNRGGGIAGYVYDTNGDPLANVSVDVAVGGYGQCTDASGHFQMDGLPYNTEIKVYAGGPGWGSCSESRLSAAVVGSCR